MNIEGLLFLLEEINGSHPGAGMRMDVIEKGGCIKEFRVEIFDFPTVGVRLVNVPATHVYMLTRTAFDTWQRKVIRGG